MPVEITVKLLLAAMKQSKTKSFLVDGFPRSRDNYEGWCSVVGDQADVACCLFYECGQEELERRLLDRGTHLTCFTGTKAHILRYCWSRQDERT